MVSRGEIWFMNLDPTVESEIKKTRPCLVVSPPEMHDHLRTVIVAPMTTGSRPASFRVEVSHVGKRGLILPHQTRAVDKARLATKLGIVLAKTHDNIKCGASSLCRLTTGLAQHPLAPQRYRRHTTRTAPAEFVIMHRCRLPVSGNLPCLASLHVGRRLH